VGSNPTPSATLLIRCLSCWMHSLGLTAQRLERLRSSASRDLTALPGQPLPQGFRDGFRSLLSPLLAAGGIEFHLSRLAFELIKRREVSQAFFGDFAAVIGTKIVELSSGVGLMPSTR
jgi:hypothetical protein